MVATGCGGEGGGAPPAERFKLGVTDSPPPPPPPAAAQPGAAAARPTGTVPPEPVAADVAAAPTSDAPASAAAPAADQLALGKEVFEAQRCGRCHRMGGTGGPPPGGPGGPGGRGPGGPNLANVGSKPGRTVQWLSEHVRDPKAHNPRSRMPAFGEDKISETDLAALGEYLASLK